MLSWVNVARPLPQQWVDTYEVLHSSLQSFINLMPSDDGSRSRAEQTLERDITLEFFASMLSRLHINSFRCSKPWTLNPEPSDARGGDDARVLCGAGG